MVALELELELELAVSLRRLALLDFLRLDLVGIPMALADRVVLDFDLPEAAADADGAAALAAESAAESDGAASLAADPLSVSLSV